MKDYNLEDFNLFNLKIKKVIYNLNLNKPNLSFNYKNIIIHHSGNSNTISKIIDLHIKKNNWDSIGYHFLINNCGEIYYSRSLEFVGAHCFSFNKDSIGICILGNMDLLKPTIKQIKSLKNLINILENNFKIKKVLGHNQAIFSILKKDFLDINLKKFNPVDILKDDYKKLIFKVINNSKNKELSKKFKSCPGYNMFKIIKNLEKL